MYQRTCYAFTCIFLCSTLAAAAELRVITDRTTSHIRPIIEQFEAESRTKVSVLYVKKGFLQRVKSRPSEADVIFTKNLEQLATLGKQGKIAPFKSEKIKKNVAHKFIDKDNFFLATSYRVRAIYADKNFKLPDNFDYDYLAEPSLKGSVCMRSGYHEYNLSLFSQLRLKWGKNKFKIFIRGLKANLARKPKGNDRAQVEAIIKKICKVAIANSYYHGIMQGNPKQKIWADGTAVYFPDQGGLGSQVLLSGAAITKGKNQNKATKLLEFLVTEKIQKFFTRHLHSYSVLKQETELSQHNKTLGKQQKQVQNGVFKINSIPLEKTSQERLAILKVLNDVKFDE